MNLPPLPTRRDVLKSAALGAAAVSVAAAFPGLLLAQQQPRDLIVPAQPPVPRPDGFHGLKIGVASYTYRNIPLDDTIKAIKRLGMSYVSIKENHLSLKSTTEERKAVAKKFADAGITVLSCGNISLRNDEPSVRNAFQYCQDVGATAMVCAPDENVLPLLDKLVKEYPVKIAIHNHGPEDKKFPSPYTVWKAVENLDPRVGLCIDVGHTTRAGVDAAESIRKCKDRLYDVHMKDIASKTGGNTAREVGRGVLDIRSMLQALLDIKFTGHVGFEYEKDDKDPTPGVAESVGYIRGVLSGMGA